MRLAPLDPRYPTDVRSPRVLQRMMGDGLRDHGNISARNRELMILRTCVRCRAQFEWCARIATFNDKRRWTAAQVRSIVHGGAGDVCWNPQDRLVIRAADQLHETSRVDGALGRDLSAHFAPDQVAELFAIHGLYLALSHLVDSAGMPGDLQTIEQPIPT